MSVSRFSPSPLHVGPPQAQENSEIVPEQSTNDVQQVGVASPGTPGNQRNAEEAMNATRWSTNDVEQQPNKRLRRSSAFLLALLLALLLPLPLPSSMSLSPG
eukprot:1396315-Rhodomonas_salina.1